MIIVSQDKTDLINFDNASWLYVEPNDFTINIALKCGDSISIAEYKTLKRAKEVLQEILRQKAIFELYKLAPTGGKEQTEMLEEFAQRRIILDTYEMPEE